MRRLPVYFLLDTSGSMNGEPIEALNNSLNGMIRSLRTDPQALDSLWISIIKLDEMIPKIKPLNFAIIVPCTAGLKASDGSILNMKKNAP
jgi:uncharacterized protein YegL